MKTLAKYFILMIGSLLLLASNTQAAQATFNDEINILNDRIILLNSDESSLARETLDTFIGYLNIGDSQIYNIIDSSNQDLIAGIDKYLHEIYVSYELKDTTKVAENHYKIEARISAKGDSWNVNGFTTYFEVKEIGNEYKIIKTDLFEIIGPENILNLTLKIIMIVFGIMFAFGLIATIIIFVVIRNIRKRDKEKELQLMNNYINTPVKNPNNITSQDQNVNTINDNSIK